jgi:hypothetical protein
MTVATSRNQHHIGRFVTVVDIENLSYVRGDALIDIWSTNL